MVMVIGQRSGSQELGKNFCFHWINSKHKITFCVFVLFQNIMWLHNNTNIHILHQIYILPVLTSAQITNENMQNSTKQADGSMLRTS